MLRPFFHRWEQSIFDHHADDRRPQAFGWGLDNLAGFVPAGSKASGELAGIAERICSVSDEFYANGAMTGVTFDRGRLAFDSPLPAVDQEVERASARLFESADPGRRAIIVIPQWNADKDSMVGACGILNRFGFDALRMTLPYHEERKPTRMVRADAMVSPVLGLTLQEVRRAVIEVKQAAKWLRARGYQRIGLMGTSLGSCIGFLALAHDDTIDAAAFNHVAGYFADVVWEGLATRHVRESLDSHVDLATLRRCWGPISPANFAARLRRTRPPMLMVSGAYDPIFLPAHGQSLVDALRVEGVAFRRVVLPCGHYTLGRMPFVVVDAALIIHFFRRTLGGGGDPR